MPFRNTESHSRIIRIIAGILCGLLFSSVLWTAHDLTGTTGVDKMLILFYLLPAFTLLAGTILFVHGCKSGLPKAGITDILMVVGAAYVIINYYSFGCIAKTRLLLVLSLFTLYCDLRILLTYVPNLKQIIITVLLILAALESVLGLVQLYGWLFSYHPLFKITGTFLNPGPYAGYLVVIAPLAIYQLTAPERKSRFLNLLSWVVLFSVMAILPSTESRTSWVALLTATLILAFREKRWGHKIRAVCSQHKIYVWGGIIVFVCALMASMFALYRMKPVSADGRLLMWKVSSQVAADHPVFGVGFGNFKGAFADQQATYFAAQERPMREQLAAGSPDYAFNDPLQIFAELGLVGFGLFIAVAYLTLKGLSSQKNGLLYAAVGLLIFSLASYPFSLLPFGVLAIFFAAAGAPVSVTTRFRYLPIVGTCVGVILMFQVLTLHYGIQYNKAVQQWNLFRSAYQQRGQKSIWSEYEKNSAFLTDESSFVIEYADCLHQIGRIDSARMLLESHKALLNDPDDFILMAQIYETGGDLRQAEKYLEYAMWHSPGRINASYSLADFYVRHDQIVKGVDLAHTTLKKQPKTASPKTIKIQHQLRQIIHDYSAK